MKTLFFLPFFLALPFMAVAQQENKPSVTVSGEGVVRVVPDEVTLRVSVETTGKDAKSVKSKNDTSVDGVLDFLKQAGISSKHVQTQHVQLHKNYDYNTKVYSYKAVQSIRIFLESTDRYETVVSGIVDRGINRIDSVVFSTSEKESLAAEARKKAIENAKAKAEDYVGPLGQSVGKAMQINETQNQDSPVPVYRMAYSDAMNESAGETETLAAGEITIRAKVYVTFALQ